MLRFLTWDFPDQTLVLYPPTSLSRPGRAVNRFYYSGFRVFNLGWDTGTGASLKPVLLFR